ncbi:MAG: phosphatase PAP2 family protein [bacterium]|nr:phosphatase PAP2 family protein [Candidatus Kapabacteria bacterium]
MTTTAPGNHSWIKLSSVLAIAIAVIVLAHCADWWTLHHLAMPRFQESDLGRMFRIVGFIPLWICIAIAIVLTSDETSSLRARMRRGVLVLSSAIVGGMVAEVAKILIRRERPSDGIDHYVFRPWGDDALYSGGFGLPSSHVLVAFVGVAMLGYLYPRARILWFVLGAGCAFSRIAAGAHFLSDVVVAAVLGYAVATTLWWFSSVRRAKIAATSANAVPTSAVSPK